MWLLKTLLFVALLVVLILFAMGNGTEVEVHLFGKLLAGVPLYLVVFASTVVGLLCGLAFAAIRELQWTMRERRWRREQAQAQREIEQLRRAPVDGLEEAERAPVPPETLR